MNQKLTSKLSSKACSLRQLQNLTEEVKDLLEEEEILFHSMELIDLRYHVNRIEMSVGCILDIIDNTATKSKYKLKKPKKNKWSDSFNLFETTS